MKLPQESILNKVRTGEIFDELEVEGFLRERLMWSQGQN